MNETIRFYRASDLVWGVFSNLYRRELTFEGERFPTSEHAYQVGKARKPEVRAWLLAAPSPSLLAMAAHGLAYWDVAPGWSQGRYDRMLRVVRAKFSQHADLAAILLSTGDTQIAESAKELNPVNLRWGEVLTGAGWVGENHLGLILMKVREELRSALELGYPIG